MRNKIYIFCTLLPLISHQTLANEHQETAEAMELNVAQAAYCVCLCCEGDTGVCKRPDILPDDYSCDPDKCSQSLCKDWKEAKCRKDCYCSQCIDKLQVNDYRCATFKDPPF